MMHKVKYDSSKCLCDYNILELGNCDTIFTYLKCDASISVHYLFGNKCLSLFFSFLLLYFTYFPFCSRSKVLSIFSFQRKLTKLSFVSLIIIKTFFDYHQNFRLFLWLSSLWSLTASRWIFGFSLLFFSFLPNVSSCPVSWGCGDVAFLSKAHIFRLLFIDIEVYACSCSFQTM